MYACTVSGFAMYGTAWRLKAPIGNERICEAAYKLNRKWEGIKGYHYCLPTLMGIYTYITVHSILRFSYFYTTWTLQDHSDIHCTSMSHSLPGMKISCANIYPHHLRHVTCTLQYTHVDKYMQRYVRAYINNIHMYAPIRIYKYTILNVLYGTLNLSMHACVQAYVPTYT